MGLKIKNSKSKKRTPSSRWEKRAEGTFKRIFEELGEPAFITVGEKVVEVNKMACEKTGFTRDELIGMDIIEDLTGGFKEAKEKLPERKERLKKGKPIRFESRLKRKDGSTFPIELTATPIKYRGKRATLSIERDITERKKAEKELQESEDKFRKVFTGTQDALWVVKVKGGNEFVYEDVNPEYCNDFSDKGREGVVGKRLNEIFERETADKISRDYEWVVREKKPLKKEQHLKFPSGWKWHLTTLSPLLDGDGNVDRIIGSGRDITDMKIAVNKISEVMGALSGGDLTKRVESEMTGDYAKLKDSINRTIDNLNVSTKQVKDASKSVATIAERVASAGTQMNRTTENMASSIQEIAKGAETQAGKISKTVKLMEEILRAAVNALTKASEMSKRAKMGADAAAAGVDATQTVAKDTAAVVETAGKVSKTIEGLAVSSEEIDKTIEVITNVAGQTNILALNAAIEAARAGEHGRGFSVVADEVRKLAENTKSSASEIKEIIKGVQKGTSEALRVVNAAMEQVMSGKESSAKSIDSIKKIETTISETLNAAQAVAEASRQQRADVDKVMKEIEEVNIIAEQTSAGTQESLSSAEELTASMQELTSSAQELSTMAQDLQAAMGNFKLRDTVAPIAAQAPSMPASNPGEKKEEK